MSNRSWTAAVAALGAVGGAALGYLIFTERGRALQGELGAAIADTARELERLRRTLREASSLVTEGWTLLNETFGDSEVRLPPVSEGQTAPFRGQR